MPEELQYTVTKLYFGINQPPTPIPHYNGRLEKALRVRSERTLVLDIRIQQLRPWRRCRCKGGRRDIKIDLFLRGLTFILSLWRVGRDSSAENDPF